LQTLIPPVTAALWGLLVSGCGDTNKDDATLPRTKSDASARENPPNNNSSKQAHVNPFTSGNTTTPEGNETRPNGNPAAGPTDNRIIELAHDLTRDSQGNVIVLDLRQAKITDRDLPGLAAFPNLKFLYLYDTRISDVASVHLRNLSNLAVLDLTATDITTQGLAKLREALPDCNIVH